MTNGRYPLAPTLSRSYGEAVTADGFSGAQQYQMQFSTSEEHVQLVERAKALMARAARGVSLGELHREAMKLLVASLQKKRFAVNTRPRKQREARVAPRETRQGQPPRQRVTTKQIEPIGAPLQQAPEAEAPRKQRVTRRRYVPAAVRRAVFERDCGQCSHVDERGQRCPETYCLELHHAEPFAKGGEHRVTNLSLRCAAHNALAAEQDFGRGQRLPESLFRHLKDVPTYHDTWFATIDEAQAWVARFAAWYDRKHLHSGQRAADAAPLPYIAP